MRPTCAFAFARSRDETKPASNLVWTTLSVASCAARFFFATSSRRWAPRSAKYVEATSALIVTSVD